MGRGKGVEVGMFPGCQRGAVAGGVVGEEELQIPENGAWSVRREWIWRAAPVRLVPFLFHVSLLMDALV